MSKEVIFDEVKLFYIDCYDFVWEFCQWIQNNDGEKNKLAILLEIQDLTLPLGILRSF